MKEKTIEDAVKNLPQDIQVNIICLWYMTHKMDLYSGNLNQYFQVILQSIKEDKDKIAELETKLRNIEKISQL